MLYYFIFLAVMGCITFAVYGIDKSKARRHAYRISEKTLLSLSVFGGCFGGLAAMLVFRHKTKHWYFYLVNVLFCAVYAIILLILNYYGVF